MRKLKPNEKLCPVCHSFAETLDGKFLRHTLDFLSETICLASGRPVETFEKCRRCQPLHCEFVKTQGQVCPEKLEEKMTINIYLDTNEIGVNGICSRIGQLNPQETFFPDINIYDGAYNFAAKSSNKITIKFSDIDKVIQALQEVKEKIKVK